MKTTYDLATLRWSLEGWAPYLWRLRRSRDEAEVRLDAAPVPGSAQGALRAAGVLPDWNVGLNTRAYEWAENRHWSYEAHIPDEWLEAGRGARLRCLGLDYSGWVLLNGREVAAFTGSLRPHVFDLTPYLRAHDNTLRIVFDCPPRWLGQFGYTSRMTEWKPRFNYTWDWTPRLVQIGVWDAIHLEITDGREIDALRVTTTVEAQAGLGSLHVSGAIPDEQGYRLRLTLEGAEGELRADEVTMAQLAAGLSWRDLPIALWWPNGQGDQPLYTLRCALVDGQGVAHDRVERRIGFKDVRWAACADAPADADPWLCVVNGRPIFLQGVNWTPIRPDFADVTDGQYRERLALYRDMGCNILRVWGGAYLEKEIFYALCDELGLLVWQEFPLSSSGADNWPPEDERSIAELTEIAQSYIERRRHHVALTLWCGGNELQGGLDGSKVGDGKPVDTTHPLIRRFARLVAEEDPTRRFLPTSSSGPRFGADEADFGKGLHWDIHGPWKPEGSLDEWERYWRHDDALFRSETGAPGASPAALIRAYRGDLPELPATMDNPLWNRTAWWIEWPQFVREYGREPASLDEYVAWSQERQARALEVAARACKERFPRCGGFIVWMGHDSFPCPANTAVVDFDGRPKPAAEALGRVFRA